MALCEQSVGDYFSATYDEGRTKFLQACQQAGLAVQTFIHPGLTGPSGEALATDCVRIGPDLAEKVLLVSCGTHGLEAAAGAATILRWFETAGVAAIPEGVAVLIVHAVNPYGWAYARRGNEDGIDLNRNFLDFDASCPENAAYAALHPMVLRASPDEQGLATFAQDFDDFAAANTRAWAISGITSGQYDYPDGLSYGGQAASWSRETLQDIARTCLGHAKHILHIDWHTGIGEYAQPFFILDDAKGSPAHTLSSSWWASYPIHCDDVLDGISIGYSGLLTEGLKAEVARLSQAQCVSLTIEWGTYEVNTMLKSLVLDNWLIHRSAMDSREAVDAARARLVEMYYPSDPEWRQSVLAKSEAIYAQALAGLEHW